jgi:hypothetical protein
MGQEDRMMDAVEIRAGGPTATRPEGLLVVARGIPWALFSYCARAGKQNPIGARSRGCYSDDVGRNRTPPHVSRDGLPVGGCSSICSNGTQEILHVARSAPGHGPHTRAALMHRLETPADFPLAESRPANAPHLGMQALHSSAPCPLCPLRMLVVLGVFSAVYRALG